ncbi:hypothetical protein QBC40DRAFT_175094 [Triangularia verruculosa]|uniref:Uncharacterized protein n=1 Tax=Triangularia verruculosa TaxID=2587418 RepID=A0AAN7AVB1_9PEZI|nr:hypothetical protein QBC40DRAFT_175094 [Triangularia verruculosa]
MWTKLTTGLCGSLLLILTGRALLTIPLAVFAADPLSNYTMTEIQWDMPITPGDLSSDTVTVTGTVEDAIAQMEALYPGWNQTFQSQLPPLVGDPGQDDGREEDTVLYSVAEKPESVLCDIEGRNANRYYIDAGIRYLRGLEGTTKPKNGPGPGNCGCVSCSWNAAIFWCNDSDSDKEVTWGGIADGAQVVNDKCKFNPKNMYVRGQVSYKGSWNVVVRRDPC